MQHATAQITLEQQQAVNTKQSKNTFLSAALKFPKKHCFLEGFQVSPVCPSGKSNMQTKMSEQRC
jgi:hypothetical protein